MGWRFIWHVIIERDDDNREPGDRAPAIVRWAVLGVAVIGATVFIIWKRGYL